ncbi:hypothetical protein [Nocardioides sp. SR21]|uniref:DUF7341 domain-containing protein n=1 Tax=Nocardioides sp. SR21 TaxID=2919501 RepID=UPI001FAA1C72|nr:hypothetical protein [Nocardioides sp. SR21]
MRTTDDRCTYSDLHPGECAHCGAAPGNAIVLEQTRLQPAAPPTTPTHRRRLPVLAAAEHGTPDIHDMIDELTRAHGHRERYTATRGAETWSAQHITEVPALVDQLLGATPGGSKDEAGAGGAKSKPAARIEAVDTLMLIDDESARWVRRLGEDDPGDQVDRHTGQRIPGSGTIACLRLLHGLHAGQEHCGRIKAHRSEGGRPDCCTQHVIEHDVRRWWHQARIITGWDTPAYRPYSTCPVCEHRGGLRINLALQAGFCVECRSVWSADEIGLLAEHIRGENAEDEADAG